MKSRKSRRSRLSAPQWALESLEERTLLTGNVLASVTSAGNLLVLGDAKANQISIQTTSGGLQVSSLDGSTKINGGAGPFTSNHVTGDVLVFLAAGDDVLKIGGGTTTTALPHNLLVGTGDGKDNVQIANTTIGGNASIFAGSGMDSVGVGGATVDTGTTVSGNLAIVGGSGADTFAVFNATIDGNLTLIGSGSNDHIQVGFDAGLGIIDESMTVPVTVGGNLIIRGDNGGDSFLDGLFTPSFFACGDRSAYSLLSSVFSEDVWGNFGDGCIGGGNRISGGEHIAVVDTTIGGNLKIATDQGNDEILIGAAHTPATDSDPFANLIFAPGSVSVSVGGHLHVHTGDGNDSLLLFFVSVTGNTRLHTGNGNDHIAVFEATAGFQGSFTLTTGKGNDDVVLADSNAFLGSVTVNLGRGNDTLWLASDLFQQSVTINGGPGNDTFLQSQSTFPNSFAGGAPTLNSIETTMSDVHPTDPVVVAAFGWLNGLLGL